MEKAIMHQVGLRELRRVTESARKLAERRRDIKNCPFKVTERTIEDTELSYHLAINNAIQIRMLLDKLDLITYEECRESIEEINEIINIAHNIII